VGVMPDPVNLASGVMLASVVFCDENARAIQTGSENHTGGTDILTQRFDFNMSELLEFRVLEN
jgi:hypothetical protein